MTYDIIPAKRMYLFAGNIVYLHTIHAYEWAKLKSGYSCWVNQSHYFKCNVQVHVWTMSSPNLHFAIRLPSHSYFKDSSNTCSLLFIYEVGRSNPIATVVVGPTTDVEVYWPWSTYAKNTLSCSWSLGHRLAPASYILSICYWARAVRVLT